jgi:hypothetical protein
MFLWMVKKLEWFAGLNCAAGLEPSQTNGKIIVAATSRIRNSL